MQPIKVFIYRTGILRFYGFGAVPGGEVDNTKAIAAAIDACNKAGGGRVIVPAGIWLTGPSTFKKQYKSLFRRKCRIEFYR